MVDTNTYRTNVRQQNLSMLREKYFSNENRKIVLKKGDTILTQGKRNDRIYYLTTGLLSGYVKSNQEAELKLFSIEPNKIAGIYSFFNGHSYTTVRAEEDSVVYYIDRSELPNQKESYAEFLNEMLPVIIEEIYIRQLSLVQSSVEKESAMKKLFHSEKLATLGQLAAGLAHELNNAIGVLHSKTQWLIGRLENQFEKQEEAHAHSFFKNGLKSGQSLSSVQVRARKKKLIEKAKLPDQVAKKLAKIDLSDEELNFIAQKGDESLIEKLYYYWEIGMTLHDMSIAADHTTHVIKSIKELGAQDHGNIKRINIAGSVSKSLALLSAMTKKIEIDLDLDIDQDISIEANEGKLIQVWMNLVKNAAESLLNSETQDPKIRIKSLSTTNNFIMTITDNGPGIDKAILSTMFQPNVTTKISGMSFGLGLGLSIVERILSAMGGAISVASVPGQTSFEVSIPKS